MKFEELMELMAIVAKLQNLTKKANTPVSMSIMGDTGFIRISTEGLEIECLNGSWVVKKAKER